MHCHNDGNLQFSQKMNIMAIVNSCQSEHSFTFSKFPQSEAWYMYLSYFIFMSIISSLFSVVLNQCVLWKALYKYFSLDIFEKKFTLDRFGPIKTKMYCFLFWSGPKELNNKCEHTLRDMGLGYVHWPSFIVTNKIWH